VEKKLVSVIIPTFNRADLIEYSIISVLNQTYQNFEIIIIDDGSTDNTREVVHSIKDKRIKYIYYKHVGLPASARNKGIMIARGEFIAFLDSDDIWLPKKLEMQIKTFNKIPNLLLVATNGIVFPTNLVHEKILIGNQFLLLPISIFVILGKFFGELIVFKQLRKNDLIFLLDLLKLKRYRDSLIEEFSFK